MRGAEHLLAMYTGDVTRAVAFSMGSDMPDAVTVVLDPEEKLEEITRVNNRVTVNVK